MQLSVSVLVSMPRQTASESFTIECSVDHSGLFSLAVHDITARLQMTIAW